MSDLDLRVKSRERISSRAKQLLLLIGVVLLGLILSISCSAQSYKKEKAKHFRSLYKDQISTYDKSCHLLERKRTQKPKANHYLASARKSRRSQAEVETSTTPVAQVTPKPKPEPKTIVAIKPSPEVVKEEKLEDEVLKENHLPAPSSAKHEQIRKKVTEHLKNKKDGEPIVLEPLYFTFAQDEFSVVDMEPFLTAVEYALQGKIILIEGHTDNTGKDDYNVQLSIKRVQKIRELMQAMGVPDDRISVVGYGEEVSKHDNKTAQGRQMNRRVDFKAF